MGYEYGCFVGNFDGLIEGFTKGIWLGFAVG